MDLTPILVISQIITALVLAYGTLKEIRPKQEVSSSQRDENVTAAIKNLADSLKMTSDELVENLADAAKLRQELHAEREATKQRVIETNKHREAADKVNQDLMNKIDAMEISIDELETGKQDLLKQVDELRSHNESTEREYVKVITNLQQENADLKKEFDVLRGKYENAKQALSIMMDAMKRANIKVPDELSQLLGDSVKGLKWPKE